MIYILYLTFHVYHSSECFAFDMNASGLPYGFWGLHVILYRFQTILKTNVANKFKAYTGILFCLGYMNNILAMMNSQDLLYILTQREKIKTKILRKTSVG